MELTIETHETVRTICSAIVAVAALIGPILSISKYGKPDEHTPDADERRIKERRFLFMMLGSIHGLSMGLFAMVLLMGLYDHTGVIWFTGGMFTLSGIWALCVLGSNL